MDRHQPGTRTLTPRRSPVLGSVPMRLLISSTTGSRFELSVPETETVEGLRRRLAQRIRVPKDRLVLLHKDTQLNAGKLLDQGVCDGSRITLVPAVEAGLAHSQSSRPEQTMVQALESLTETQVGDFLCGRSPLTLALGVGAHVMYVQLQLAAQSSAPQQQATPPGSAHGGGKVHAGKSGSSRASRPYPSPPFHPVADDDDGQRAPPSPSPAPQTPSPAPSPSPSSHRIPVIQRPPHPKGALLPVSCPPHTPQPRAPPSSPSLPSPLLPPHPPGSGHAPQSHAPQSHAPQSHAPQSPAPAATYPEVCVSSSQRLSREAGAVIESFVSRSPGVFSGTFSGTLPPVSHPRRGVATILHILNDLLSATRLHQGAPPSLSQLRCPAPPAPPPSSSDSSPSSDSAHLTSSRTADQLGSAPSGRPAGKAVSSQEENRVLRRKLERLQLLMHQRRQRRRARRATPPSSSSGPAHLLLRPRPPCSPARRRRAARRSSSSSLSGGEGTARDDDAEEAELTDEPPWKPEMTSDLVVA